MLEQPDYMPVPKVASAGGKDTCGSASWLYVALKSHLDFMHKLNKSLVPNAKFTWMAISGRMGLKALARKKKPDDAIQSAKALLAHHGTKRLSHNILFTLVDALGGVDTHHITLAAEYERRVRFASSDALQSKGWQQRVELCLLYDIPIVPLRWLLLFKVLRPTTVGSTTDDTPPEAERTGESRGDTPGTRPGDPSTFMDAVQRLAQRGRGGPVVLQVGAGRRYREKGIPNGSEHMVIRTKQTSSERPVASASTARVVA